VGWTTTRSATPRLTDAIADGEVNLAPTQNAVFDALAEIQAENDLDKPTLSGGTGEEYIGLIDDLGVESKSRFNEKKATARGASVARAIEDHLAQFTDAADDGVVASTSVDQTSALFLAMTRAGTNGGVRVNDVGAYRFADATPPNNARIFIGPGVSFSNPTHFSSPNLFNLDDATMNWESEGYSPSTTTMVNHLRTLHQEREQYYFHATRNFQATTAYNTPHFAFMESFVFNDDITPYAGAPTFPTGLFGGIRHSDYRRGFTSPVAGVGIETMHKVFVGDTLGSDTDTKRSETTQEYAVLFCNQDMDNGGQGYLLKEWAMMLPAQAPARTAIGFQLLMFSPAALAARDPADGRRGIIGGSIWTTAGYGIQAGGQGTDVTGLTGYPVDCLFCVGGYSGVYGTVQSGDDVGATPAAKIGASFGGNYSIWNSDGGSSAFATSYMEIATEFTKYDTYGAHFHGKHANADASTRSILIASDGGDMQINTRLMFGGGTASYPSLINNGAALEAKLADDSEYANVNVARMQAKNGFLHYNSSGASGEKYVRDILGATYWERQFLDDSIATPLSVYRTERSGTTPTKHRFFLGANGASVDVQYVTTTLSGVSGASVTASSLIPAGSYVLGVTTRVTTTLGNGSGTTGYNVGDGSDVDRWGVATLITSGVVTGASTGSFRPTADPTGYFYSASNVVITAVGGNFNGTGVIRVTVAYFNMTGPTS